MFMGNWAVLQASLIASKIQQLLSFIKVKPIVEGNYITAEVYKL